MKGVKGERKVKEVFNLISGMIGFVIIFQWNMVPRITSH